MLEELNLQNSSLVAEFQRIYEDSFPSEERRPFKELITDQHAGNYTMYVSFEKKKVKGIISLFRPSNCKFVLLDYFAVHPEYRSKGMGSGLFKELIAECQKTRKILCLEVEQPLSDDVTDDRCRRISFYRKGGAKVLTNYTYLLPDLDHSGVITKMCLMFVGGTTLVKMERSELAMFIESIFFHLYKRNMENEQLKHNLRELPTELILN